jgi:hypothetical protein
MYFVYITKKRICSNEMRREIYEARRSQKINVKCSEFVM